MRVFSETEVNSLVQAAAALRTAQVAYMETRAQADGAAVGERSADLEKVLVSFIRPDGGTAYADQPLGRSLLETVMRLRKARSEHLEIAIFEPRGVRARAAGAEVAEAAMELDRVLDRLGAPGRRLGD